MELQIGKWGNSLAVRIPNDVVRRLNLREGDAVDAQLSVDGGLTLRPANWSRAAFAQELDLARCALPMGQSVIEELRQGARY